MSRSFAQSRWPTHVAAANLAALPPGGDLGHPLEARRCTVQLSTGRLYLDAVASNATALFGHDAPPAVPGTAPAHQLLSALEPGYTCIGTTRTFSAAVSLASQLARAAVGEHGHVADVNTLDGEPAAACDCLIAYENETVGRAGRWCASAAWRHPPELIVIGEAIALGASFGAVLGRQDRNGSFAAVCAEASPDQAAYPATLAQVAAVITAVESGELLQHGRKLGDYLLERLRAVQATCPEIETVERNGLSFRIAFAPPLTASQVLRRMCARGVLAGVDASGRLALDPPLPLRIAEADVITGALRGALLDLPLVSASACCPACAREG